MEFSSAEESPASWSISFLFLNRQLFGRMLCCSRFRVFQVGLCSGWNVKMPSSEENATFTFGFEGIKLTEKPQILETLLSSLAFGVSLIWNVFINIGMILVTNWISCDMSDRDQNNYCTSLEISKYEHFRCSTQNKISILKVYIWNINIGPKFYE